MEWRQSFRYLSSISGLEGCERSDAWYGHCMPWEKAPRDGLNTLLNFNFSVT